MSLARDDASDSYVLGGYEIIATAGAGGMGIVYQGEDKALGRIVAIKVLKNDLQPSPAVVARFRREAEAIAALNHPNIVRVYAVGDADGLPYIVMEYVDGVPLSDILVDNGSLPWEEALDIGSQVADALACAHECQVIHRDIKPGNILVDNNGQVKVTDFGIAKVLNASTQLTVDGARIGTPQYMCPERCRNQSITHSSDIYAVGVTLFQCITGRLPYDATSSAELITKIANQTPHRVRDFKPDTPERVDRLIAYLLEKDAAHRPATSRAMREAIDRVRRGESVAGNAPAMETALTEVRAETPPPTPTPQPTTTGLDTAASWISRRWYQLHRYGRILIALAVLATLLAVAGMAVSNWFAAPLDVAKRFRAHTETDRWTERPSLARFVAETPSVQSCEISLKDFQIASLQWVGGADGVVAALNGVAGSGRAGQSALVTINPYLGRADVILPPTPPTIAGSAPFRLLDGGAKGPPGLLVARGGATWLLDTRPGATPQEVVPWEASIAARWGDLCYLVSDRGVLAAAALAPIDRSDLAPAPGVSQPTLPAAGEIRALALHPGTGRLAVYASEPPQLAVYGPNGDAYDTLFAAGGRVRLGRHPFSGNGGRLVYMELAENTGGVAVVQSLRDQHDRQMLGAALQTAWRPGAGEILLLAPDHAGRCQLWLVHPEAGAGRRQFTFLDAGLGHELAVSSDGQYAMVNTPTPDRIIIVNLPDSP